MLTPSGGKEDEISMAVIGSVLMASDDCTAKIWSCTTGECLLTLVEHKWREGVLVLETRGNYRMLVGAVRVRCDG